FNKEQVLKAGMLRPNTKSIGLSFGDRACLALAIFLNQPVLTTDRLWGSINVGVEVRVVR
ncbi:MAG: VapC toxin family PIN domain ribonuclease, partial [Dolichospermum sp.]